MILRRALCRHHREASAGHLRVQTSSGAVTPEMKNIVRMYPMENGFRVRTTGSLELGFNFNLSSGCHHKHALDGEGQRRGQNWVTDIGLNSLLDKNNGRNVQVHSFLNIDARRLLARRRFAMGLFQAQDDKFLSLDRRIVASGAVGENAVQSAQTTLALFGGLNYEGKKYANRLD